MPTDDTNVEFFRCVHNEFTPAEEISLGIRAALEIVFGADAKAYYRGIKGVEDA